jgi:L-ascorbate metabolism protein UlaG (beta-lactamase superfamily)
MRIERVAHTCYLIENGQDKIVIDPAMDFYNEMWMSKCERPLSAHFLKDVSAIFISHSHTDHFHLPSLVFAPKNIPIYLTSKDIDSKWSMKNELISFGFEDIRYIDDWETIKISNINITGIPAPDSIESIPQLSYLVESDGTTFLDTVDTLENDEIFQRVKDNYHVDILALPVNCSLNYGNLRNQMSPSTALHTVELVKPSVFVATGVNYCRENEIFPSSIPMFPYDEKVIESNFFQNLVSDETKFLNLKDNTVLDISGHKDSISIYVEELKGQEQTKEISLNNTLGRLISNLIKVNIRDEYYFGLKFPYDFENWKYKWLECLSELREEQVDIYETILNVSKEIPLEYNLAPIMKYFPKTIDYAFTINIDIQKIIAKSLTIIDSDYNEFDYVKGVYELLLSDTELKNNKVKDLCHLEYLKFFQIQHAKRRPNKPVELNNEHYELLVNQQLENDLKAAKYIYPKFNPIFEKISLEKKWIMFMNKGVCEDQNLQELVDIITTVQKEENKYKYKILLLSNIEKKIVDSLMKYDGKKNLLEITEIEKIEIDNIKNLFKKILRFEPFALELYWTPKTGYSWDPRLELNEMTVQN